MRKAKIPDWPGSRPAATAMPGGQNMTLPMTQSPSALGGGSTTSAPSAMRTRKIFGIKQ